MYLDKIIYISIFKLVSARLEPDLVAENKELIEQGIHSNRTIDNELEESMTEDELSYLVDTAARGDRDSINALQERGKISEDLAEDLKRNEIDSPKKEANERRHYSTGAIEEIDGGKEASVYNDNSDELERLGRHSDEGGHGEESLFGSSVNGPASHDMFASGEADKQHVSESGTYEGGNGHEGEETNASEGDMEGSEQYKSSMVEEIEDKAGKNMDELDPMDIELHRPSPSDLERRKENVKFESPYEASNEGAKDLHEAPLPAEPGEHSLIEKEFVLEAPHRPENVENEQKALKERSRDALKFDMRSAVGEGAYGRAIAEGMSPEAATVTRQFVMYADKQRDILIKDKGFTPAEADQFTNRLMKNAMAALSPTQQKALTDIIGYNEGKKIKEDSLDLSVLKGVDSNVLQEAARLSKQEEEEHQNNLTHFLDQLKENLVEDSLKQRSIEDMRIRAENLKNEANEMEKNTMISKTISGLNQPSAITTDPVVRANLEASQRNYANQEMTVKSVNLSPNLIELQAAARDYKKQEVKNTDIIDVWRASKLKEMALEQEAAKEVKIRENKERQLMMNGISQADGVGNGPGAPAIDSDVLQKAMNEPKETKDAEERQVESMIEQHMGDLRVAANDNVLSLGGSAEAAAYQADKTVNVEQKRLGDELKEEYQTNFDILKNQVNDEGRAHEMARHMSLAHGASFPAKEAASLENMSAAEDDQAKKMVEEMEALTTDPINKLGIISLIPDETTEIEIEDGKIKLPLPSNAYASPKTKEDEKNLADKAQVKELIRNTKTSDPYPQAGLVAVNLGGDEYLQLGENFDEIGIEDGMAIMTPEAYDKAKDEGRDLSMYEMAIDSNGQPFYQYKIADMKVALPKPGDKKNLSVKNDLETVDLNSASELVITKGKVTGQEWSDYANYNQRPKVNTAVMNDREVIEPEERNEFEEKSQKFEDLEKLQIYSGKSIDGSKVARMFPDWGNTMTEDPEMTADKITKLQRAAVRPLAGDAGKIFDAEMNRQTGETLGEFLVEMDESVYEGLLDEAENYQEGQSSENGKLHHKRKGGFLPYGRKLRKQDRKARGSSEMASSEESVFNSEMYTEDELRTITIQGMLDSVMTQINPLTGKQSEKVAALISKRGRRAGDKKPLEDMKKDALIETVTTEDIVEITTYNDLINLSGPIAEKLHMSEEAFIDMFSGLGFPNIKEMVDFIGDLLDDPTNALKQCKTLPNSPWYTKLASKMTPPQLRAFLDVLASSTAKSKGLPDPSKAKFLSIVTIPNNDNSPVLTGPNNRKKLAEFKNTDNGKVCLSKLQNQLNLQANPNTNLHLKPAVSPNQSLNLNTPSRGSNPNSLTGGSNPNSLTGGSNPNLPSGGSNPNLPSGGSNLNSPMMNPNQSLGKLGGTPPSMGPTKNSNLHSPDNNRRRNYVSV